MFYDCYIVLTHIHIVVCCFKMFESLLCNFRGRIDSLIGPLMGLMFQKMKMCAAGIVVCLLFYCCCFCCCCFDYIIVFLVDDQEQLMMVACRYLLF
jgi:hypothetical protein